MPRSLILHIGTPKTGSTTIQHVLSQNQEALRDQGCLYPLWEGTPQAKSHMLLSRVFASPGSPPDGFDDPMWNGKDPATVMREYQAAFKQEMLALPDSITRVIISSEQFPQLTRDVADIARLRDMMAPLFDDIKVIVYLRRQDEHIASTYSQSLRRGVIRKPSFKRWDKDEHYYDYAKMLDNWASVFGERAIVPRIFERGADKRFDVVEDFLTQAGVAPLPATEAEAPKNQSMNLSGQRILREIGQRLTGNEGRRHPQTMLWKRLTRAVTAALPGSGWRPTQDEAREFMTQFTETNEAVRSRWFPERESLFSTDFSHLPAEPLVSDRQADKQATYTVIIHLLQQAIAAEQGTAKRNAEMPKQNDQRRRSLVRAIKHDPEDADARLQLAALQIDDGQTRAARHNLQEILKLTPDNAAARGMLAALDGDDGDADPD